MLSTDPEVIISLFAFLIALASFIFTLLNQKAQNRRWDKLNEGFPEISEIRFINWLEITKEQAFNTQWGYDPHIYATGEASNIFVLPYYLKLRKTDNNEDIQRSNPVFTIEEVRNELKRIDYRGKFSIYKLFRPKFEVENAGKTEINLKSINIDAKHANSDEWRRAFTSNTEITLAGNQKTTVHFDWEVPLNSTLPDQITYKIYFKYVNHNGKTIEKTVGVKWTSKDNYWSYEKIIE